MLAVGSMQYQDDIPECPDSGMPLGAAFGKAPSSEHRFNLCESGGALPLLQTIQELPSAPNHEERLFGRDSAADTTYGSSRSQRGQGSRQPPACSSYCVGASLRAFTIRCVSLGRRDGLVQFTDWNDAPLPKVWTGRRSVFVKEMICRMTYWVVKNELRTGLRLYRWPTSPVRLVAVPAAESPH